MFQFTQDCIIGIEELDNDHRHLFELIECCMRLLEDTSLADRYEQVTKILEELTTYSDEHFAREEAYMREIRDPELLRQCSQHNFFRQKISRLQFSNIADDAKQQEVLESLIHFLVKWLYRHILGSDIMIGKLPPMEEWMLRENPCEFTEQFRTGIPLIDEEHEELFHIISQADKLARAYVADSYDEIVHILDRLKDYTQKHFEDEEAYMESIGYNGLEAQKRAHAAFIERLNNISYEEIDRDTHDYLNELLEFLLSWLINHILYSDKKIPNKTF